MRVLMFGWEFPPYQAGGLATACRGLVKGLAWHQVHTVFVVPFPTEGGNGHSVDPSGRVNVKSAFESMREVKLERITSALTPYQSASVSSSHSTSDVPNGTYTLYGRNLFEEVARFTQAASAVAGKEHHDVIDAHDWMTFDAAIEARKISGRPLVVHIHATEFDRSGSHPNEEVYRREKRGMAEADLVVANSNYLKRQVVQRYGIQEEKVYVVHWGVEDNRLEYFDMYPPPFPASLPVVLFVGRMVFQKGPDYFIEVAHRVGNFVPDARFIMAGAGDMLPRIIERAVDLSISDKVYFTGPIQPVDVFRVFNMSRVCVMPSVSEPFGIVALESLKSGTPCIVSKDSGVSEVLRNVLKVDFWDIDEMTNKVVAILRYPELQEVLKDEGIREVSSPRFGIEEPARLTHEVYQRALDFHGAHA